MKTKSSIIAGLTRWTVWAVVATLVPACGGGGGGAVAPSISGTAAQGLPIAGAPVTIKGANGITVTGTTATDGTYSADVSTLTPPYLVQVDLGGSNFLYSVGTSTGTVNVTPLTDLIIQEYYQVQGLAVDTEFAAPTVAFPSVSEINIITSVIEDIVRGWLVQASIDPDTFDLFTTPFVANGTGFDGILDITTVTPTSPTTIQVVIDDTITTQTSDVTSSTGNSSVTVDTTTVAPSGTSTSNESTVVPTPSNTPLQDATNEVNAMLAQFRNAIIAGGNQLADADLVPFHTVDFLDDGRNRTIYTGMIADEMRGSGDPGDMSLINVISFDDVTDPASPVLTALSTFNSDRAMRYKKIGSNWFFYGNRRLADADVSVEHRRDQDSTGGTGGFKKSINGGVNAPENSLTAVSVIIDPAVQTIAASTTWANSAENPWPTATNVPKNGSTTIEQFQPTPGGPTTTVILDNYYFNAGAWPGTPTINVYPPPGTLISLTVTPAVGSPETYLIPTDATTTATFTLTNPSDFLLSSANLGGTLTVTWTQPAGFLVTGQGSGCPVFAGGFQQQFDGNDLTASSTSSAFNLPATLDPGTGPLAVTSVNVNVNITGPNGERMIIIHRLDQ